jgi:phosphoglycolate phosphatase
MAHAPLLVFDFDGTLADTWRDLAAAVNRALADAGLPAVHGPDVKFWIGHGVRPLLARAVPDADDARLEALFARFSEDYARSSLDTTRLYDGIEACLAACAGATLAIASNKPEQFLLPMVEGLGIARHFDAVLGGDSLAARKPDPAVLYEVATRVGHDAFRRSEQSERAEWRRQAPTSWMIGDSAVDVATGRAAGARTIGCAWGLRGREELARAGCEFLIEHPREIAEIVWGKRP